MNRLRLALIASSIVLLASACESGEKVAPPRSDSKEARADSAKPRTDDPTSERFALAGLEHRVAVGATAKLELEVTPTGPLKINPEFPWKLTLTSPPGELGVAAPVIAKDAMTFSNTKATVPVPVAPTVAGDYTLEGTIDLSVCEADGARRCFLERAKPVTLTVKATAPAASP